MSSLKSIVFALLAMLFVAGAHAGTTEVIGDFSTSPKTNGEHKWRIAYYEGGPHGNYYEYVSALIKGLMELGWIETKVVPRHKDRNTRALWSWLSNNANSAFIDFVDDAYYSANWDQETRRRLQAEVIRRGNEQKDLDLIFALGTWAGKDLANDEHSTPTIVMSASDPVRSGIITAIQDSGRDHIYARVDPLRYERQVRMFHDVIRFGKLGVAYENTPDGRNYAAMAWFRDRHLPYTE